MALSSKTRGKGAMTPLEQLIEEINFQRAKEMRQILKDDSGFVMLHGTAYWTDLFVRHFLFEDGRSAQESDDLLFFIRKRHLKEARKYIPRYETLVEVFRRDSKKLPIGDPEIDWEETIYVNMIIHHFDYHLTLAVCTRTSPRELQVLKRHTERVWASPSRRLMSDKGTSEEITYPDICFMLDNFDEIFTDILVRDGEMVSVELVARDRDGALRGVTFLGSVRYDALKKVYDARASISNKMAQRMTFGLFSSPTAQRMEFVRMRGPLGKGHAELAVTKPPGADCETPTSEPGFMLTDQTWDSDAEDEDEYMFQKKHQRRLSDPSANFNSFMYSNFRTKPRDVAKARSESEGLNAYQDQFNEIEAGDVRDASSSVAPPKRSTHETPPQHPAHKPLNPAAPFSVGSGLPVNLGSTAAATVELGLSQQAGTAAEDPEPPRRASIASEGPTGPASPVDTAALDPVGPRSLVSSPEEERSGRGRGGLSRLCGVLCGPRSDSPPPEQIALQMLALPEPAAVPEPEPGHGTGLGTETELELVTEPGCACPHSSTGTTVHLARCPAGRRHRWLKQGAELDDGAYNPIWTMRGFSQTFHFWKESRRASSLPLRAHITYVRLPWHAIVNDLITKENREEPILTF